MNYPSIRIEGAILSPDVLDHLDDAHGQRPADYGLETSAKVKDEIARAWADAQDYWRIFQRKVEGLRPESPATTETRNNWIVPLLGLLGYQLEYQARGVELNGKNYAISHRVTNRANTPIHIIGYQEPAGLDRKPERAALRMSAHTMLQEYLNLRDELYGVVTNGRLLRLLRDSSRLIKLTYLEFDLDRIFTDGLFADFAILYRLLHATRLPTADETAAESIIERYHQDSLDSGARIRDGLSRAVEETILAFGNGFLSHPDNEGLRQAALDGSLDPQAYYQSLLRLIYRILFLLVIEERNLVYPLSPSMEKRDLYYEYYSLQRLRRLSEKRYLADKRKHDHWLALCACFRLFEANGPGHKLGIAPLAGDLFRPNAIGPLNGCTLDNETLLGCIRSLGLYQNPITHQIIRVNYAALNVEEFGSVYEGLLEYDPVFHPRNNGVEFAFAQGGERAATGSHYTPDDLVQPLIKHSLDYLIADKLKEPNPEEALLSLRVADIACGSGHILLSAARRIATELAIVRTGEEQPSPGTFREAIRDVIRECIYGVDLNPLAVELCKVALWLEAHVPGQPLNFLDHHIKCGNAIVGFARREEVERGVPDEAFKSMPGDDKDTGTDFRKTNKAERKDREKKQARLVLSVETQKHLDAILTRWREVSALPERNPAEIDAKKKRYIDFTQSQDAWLLNQIAAIPIAQFYLPKKPQNRSKLITDADFWRYWTGERHPQGEATAAAWVAAANRRFFHWFLEFPTVMEGAGFDCILGNPPYLGGVLLSGTYGHPFCHYVKWQYAPAGLSDLVVYFLRRAFALLRPAGFCAFITTNSIKDGDIRKDGLDTILRHGGTMNFATRGTKWPGGANLMVSQISLVKGMWSAKRVLDGKKVDSINAFLEDSALESDPVILAENAESLFAGYDILGDGFVLSQEEASECILSDPRNEDVIHPVFNGQELNNDPVQQASRSVVYFRDWSIERACTYARPFEIVLERVKPFRDRQKRAKNREYWWRYNETRAGLQRKLTDLAHCFGAAATTKHLNFSALPTDYIHTHAIKVLASDRWDVYALVQSTFHEVWARKYSGSLETRLRYSPTDCFETYAFPEGQWDRPNSVLAAMGERYHEHRRALMRLVWLGLTDIYNLFHDPAVNSNWQEDKKTKSKPLSKLMKHLEKRDDGCTMDEAIAGIIELRRLHVQLDSAVRDAYGWQDLNLGHDFREVETLPENDRVRYTISPDARREVLKRLLALNHQRAAEEAAAAAPVKTKGREQGGKRKRKLPVRGPRENLPDGAWERPGTNPEAEEMAVLAAILKNIDGTVPMRQVRLTALLAMRPDLLVPSLTAKQTSLWQRLVGDEADALLPGVVLFEPRSDQAWGQAVRQLRGTGLLVEDTEARTWAPGQGLAAIDTRGWPEGRVGTVMEVLAKLEVEELVASLPPDLQEWVNAEAA